MTQRQCKSGRVAADVVLDSGKSAKRYSKAEGAVEIRGYRVMGGLGTSSRHLFSLHHRPPLRGSRERRGQSKIWEPIPNLNHFPLALGRRRSLPVRLFLIGTGLRSQTKQPPPPPPHVGQHGEGWDPDD